MQDLIIPFKLPLVHILRKGILFLHHKSLLFTLLLFFNIAQHNYAQNLNVKLDSIIATVFNDANGPGGVFMITKDDEILYEKACGKANLEWDIDLSNESIFQIGSMTKQFTAVGILILEQQGKLKVNDAISNYITDYPNGQNISIHHLLTHSSGIKDFTKMTGLKEITLKEMSPVMMINFFKNEKPDFLPGEKFEYNNSGYLILGYLIENISGLTYADFMKKEIFDKVGMNHSFYASDRNVIKKRAYGYHVKEGVYVNKTLINYSLPYSSGALMSTTGDLFLWQKALNNFTLINADQTNKAFSSYQLSNGEDIQYGYGWHIKKHNKKIWREHGGSIFGYKSMAIFIPELNVYVVGLSNCDCHSPTQVVRDLTLCVQDFLIKK